MANTPRITAIVANTMLNSGLGTPANSGKLRIYTGTQPAAGGGALSGNTLLVEFPLPSTFAPSASAGTLTANAISAAVAAATGTATWFRMTQSDGSTVLLDGSVGTSGADLNIASTSINSGDTIAITSFTIGEPLL